MRNAFHFIYVCFLLVRLTQMNNIITILCLVFITKTSFSQAQVDSNSRLAKIFNVYQVNTNEKTSTEYKKVKLGFYKKHLSKQISSNCEFNITCSQFMKDGITHFGVFKGVLLGIDRVSRCGASQNTYIDLSTLFDKKGYLLIDDILNYE